MTRRRSATTLALLGLLASAASAQEVVAGWEGDLDHGYAFASRMLGIRLGAHHGVGVRFAASYLYYQFPDLGGLTEVTSPGIAAGLAYRVRSRRLTATIGPGFEVRRTARRPAAGTHARVTERDVTAQGDVFFQPTPLTSVSALFSYSHAHQYLWSRVAIKRQLTNTRFTRPAALGVGVEMTAHRNENVRAYQAGAVVALELLRARASLQFRAGYTPLRHPADTGESRAYFGVGFYRGL
jgi:hypothetical protein